MTATKWSEWDLELDTFPDPFWNLIGRETTEEEEEEALEQFWYETKKRSKPMKEKRCEDMKLEMLGNRLLVRRDASVTKSEGGIVLPDSAQAKAQIGTVTAVGPGEWSETAGRVMPPNVEVGDRIYFTKYAGNEVPELGEDLLILRECDVLCKVED